MVAKGKAEGASGNPALNGGSSPVPPPGYREAREGVAVFPRGRRRILEVRGQNPALMLNGVLSGSIPGPLGAGDTEWLVGSAPRSGILTPKGKMVTELRLMPRPEEGFLLDLPDAGLEGIRAHFKKYVNPRFAQLLDPSPALALLTVLGPGGRETLSMGLGVGVPPVPEGEVRFLPGGGGPGIWVAKNHEVDPEGVDLVLSRRSLRALLDGFREKGVPFLDPSVWEMLRIEAGTPLFGVDMTEDTIPVEAGIHERIIDYQKGCYTGQEVIVRIRDRGKVARHLRRLLCGQEEPPPPGTELFEDAPPTGRPKDGEVGDEHAEGEGGGASPVSGGGNVGWVTSSCRSPALGQSLALGYVKRRVEVGDSVRLGYPAGPPCRVEELT